MQEGASEKVKQSGKAPPLGRQPFVVATAARLGRWPGASWFRMSGRAVRANREHRADQAAAYAQLMSAVMMSIVKKKMRC